MGAENRRFASSISTPTLCSLSEPSTSLPRTAHLPDTDETMEQDNSQHEKLSCESSRPSHTWLQRPQPCTRAVSGCGRVLWEAVVLSSVEFFPQHVWKVWRAGREVEALSCCCSQSLVSVEREVYALCKRAPVICKRRSLPVPSCQPERVIQGRLFSVCSQ